MKDGSNRSTTLVFPHTVSPMQSRHRIPEIQFRVLIIGRANAGKTSILQRVCETTESPIIYQDKEQVRTSGQPFFVCKSDLTFDKVKLDPSIDVSDDRTSLRLFLNMVQRGKHNINDEIVFSNHPGYIFHDSRGIESGSTEELGILQEFIRRKCEKKRLRDRLHTIWFGLLSVQDYDN